MRYTYKCPACATEKIVQHEEAELWLPTEKTVSEITCDCADKPIMEVQIWEGLDNYGKCNCFGKFASASIPEKRAMLAKRSKEHDEKHIKPLRQHMLNNLSNGNWDNPKK